MAVNKVVYNRRTLIDLTADTVSKETLKKGFTAHQADGTMITGEFIGDDYDEIDRILTAGLTDGYKHFSDDGTIISTIDSQGRTLVKTFSNDFLTCITVLTDPDGNELGRTVRSFPQMGRTSLRPWFMGNKMQFEAVACRLFLHYSYTLAQKASNYGIFCFFYRNLSRSNHF